MEETVVLDREMGCTRAEFMRWLGGATRQAPRRLEGEEIALAVGAGEVRIALAERPPRRIALVSVPVLAVRFRFLGLDAPARENFLATFDAYTRRGGG
ncbi:MAG TPA: hypothetical protein VEP68_10670 [Anaeromyxobacteraceae bacterium]|nr:hypothetical protein [Anaeromyxobacteraceae bacterium]